VLRLTEGGSLQVGSRRRSAVESIPADRHQLTPDRLPESAAHVLPRDARFAPVL